MPPEEAAILVGLLFAFYITVKHPFVIASLIGLFVVYLRYFADKIQFDSDDKQFESKKEVVKDNNDNVTNSEDTPIPIKKSQRQILAEIEATEPPPKEKFSKLLLTYQVPNMTQYYEDLVQFIQS